MDFNYPLILLSSFSFHNAFFLHSQHHLLLPGLLFLKHLNLICWLVPTGEDNEALSEVHMCVVVFFKATT